MSEPPASQTSSHGWLKVGLVVLGIALVFGAALIWQWYKGSQLQEPALATATFADGFRVEVVRCELTPRLTHRSEDKSLFSFLPVKSSRGRSFVHHAVVFSNEQEGKRMTTASIEHQSKQPCLMVLLRGSWPNGKSYTSDTFVMDEGRDLTLTQRDGTCSTGLRQAPPSPVSALEACGLLMEAEDGQGGWLSVSGPLFADTRDAHALGLCAGFPRASPTLRLRFLRPGQTLVEVQVPNPGFRASFPPLKAEPLPLVRESNRYRVELERLRIIQGAPAGRLVFRPEFKIEAKAGWTKDWLATDLQVEDAQGNLVSFSSSHLGHLPIPGQRVVRLRHTLKPSAVTYPWQASEGTFIAEGTWDASGKMASARITSDGRGLGFKEIEITPAWSGPASLVGLPRVIDVSIKGEGDESAWVYLHGLSPQLHLVMFEAGSQTASGRFGNPSNGSTHSGSRCWWDTRSTWHGSPKAGSSFRLAIVPQPPPEEHEFVVELPATTTP